MQFKHSKTSQQERWNNLSPKNDFTFTPRMIALARLRQRHDFEKFEDEFCWKICHHFIFGI